ncbi:hypothetical protein [Actinoplanes sp. NPDC049265]|uniref:hypothetical protein n=1 Tax=Actinoplanes sp. NPDC049265 TaxID=3363902 RepID=UPI00370FC6A1
MAAGLPAVGVTALAALAFAGTPAYATGEGSANAGRPAVMATPTCNPDEKRSKCDASADPDSDGYGGGAAAPTTAVPNDNATAGGNDDDRGNQGYGSESPTPAPSETTPSGGTDTVPPGGELPETVPPSGGVNAGTLPLTGPPMGTMISVGAVLLAGGALAVWYTRRRREA